MLQAWSFINICILLYLFFFYYSLTSFLKARNQVVFVHCIPFVSQEKCIDLFFSNRLQKLISFFLLFPCKCPQTVPWCVLEKKEEDLCVVPQPCARGKAGPELPAMRMNYQDLQQSIQHFFSSEHSKPLLLSFQIFIPSIPTAHRSSQKAQLKSSCKETSVGNLKCTNKYKPGLNPRTTEQLHHSYREQTQSSAL